MLCLRTRFVNFASRGAAALRYVSSNMSASTSPRVAVVFQDIEPPVINGVRKPKKPGGYRDSGADIAYVLRKAQTTVITPKEDASPENEDDWCFPDSEAGILEAIEKGATHIWCNTIVFSSHPLQQSPKLDHHASSLYIVGQPPQLVEQYDDKNFINDLLRKDRVKFNLPQFQLIDSIGKVKDIGIAYPLVAKPIRGRGSHGVKLCHNEGDLNTHLKGLLDESPLVMLEQYLSGQEGTVTVMPPSNDSPKYTALPIVVRFNHEDGIAPYNGVVAVTANSRIPLEMERADVLAYTEVEKSCERVAEKLKVTAPIRIDVRQFTEDKQSKFAIFDVNMKPNMTGPGRPGREDQASLTALAAEELGWDYSTLLQKILNSAQPLSTLRERKIEL